MRFEKSSRKMPSVCFKTTDYTRLILYSSGTKQRNEKKLVILRVSATGYILYNRSRKLTPLPRRIKRTSFLKKYLSRHQVHIHITYSLPNIAKARKVVCALENC